MDEVMFRAWEKSTNSMIKWFELVMMYIPKGIHIWSSTGDLKLMQWTGLTDKNGVSIYEDDLVSILGGHKHGIIYRVVWERGAFRLYTHSKYGEEFNPESMGNFNGEVFEVIGNIYENPELWSETTEESYI